ncbi:hypothetical protein ACJDU8_03065 [Clostridium sp. WILCCON 0269]|uniref:Uncharacterized protein n=1 Tax=Candidatus Clostridium eludens TaxID=3381663 RepID=A0ABW8SH96_9CLOT
MTFNIIIGFLIPWILGVYMYIREKILFIVIYPFGCAVSYTINIIGFYFKFWSIVPYKYGVFASLPLNLGLYPIAGTYFVFLLYRGVVKAYYLILVFSLVTTEFEYLMLIFKRGVYGFGWNLFWTFISYSLAYILAYYFYRLVRIEQILSYNK